MTREELSLAINYCALPDQRNQLRKIIDWYVQSVIGEDSDIEPGACSSVSEAVPGVHGWSKDHACGYNQAKREQRVKAGINVETKKGGTNNGKESE